MAESSDGTHGGGNKDLGRAQFPITAVPVPVLFGRAVINFLFGIGRVIDLDLHDAVVVGIKEEGGKIFPLVTRAMLFEAFQTTVWVRGALGEPALPVYSGIM